ncbi:MAG: hypothetical protein ACXVNM_01645 [Bacteroidia bacterium]
MMKEKFLLLFTTVIVALFFVNKHFYDNRFNGYLYTEALNYNELYIPQDAHKINALGLKADSLKLIITPTPAKTNWTITDSKNNSYNLAAELPYIKLQPGQNTYTLSSELPNKKLKHIVTEVEYTPDSSPNIVNINLPLIEYEIYPVNKWSGLPPLVSEAEIAETKKILKDEIKISDSLTSVEKIKLIGAFLIKNLRASEGPPQGNMKELSPLIQYKIACKKENKVDCANYTDIFHLFANCAGVPTRKIGLMGSISGISTSGHVLNESYISEQEKWAFVDLTAKKLLVLNSRNEVLNTADLFNSLNAYNFEGKKAIFINEKNHIDTVDYATVNQSEIDFLKPTTLLYIIKPDINNNMNFKETFTEYLGTTSHYGTCYINSVKVDNSKHYLKLFIFNCSMALFILWLAYLAIRILFSLTIPLLKVNRGNS